MRDFADFEILDRIVIDKVKPIAPTNEEFAAYLDRIISLIEAVEEPIVIITDISESKMITSEQRVMLSDVYRNNRALFKKKLAGLAYVIQSPLLRMMLINVFTIASEPPVDYVILNHIDKAMRWAKNRV